MSKPPKHPVCVVRVPSGYGCGHQHKRPAAARSCARALLQRRHSPSYVDVVAVSRDGERLLERLER